MKKITQKCRGFTLIELMIVVAIVAFLSMVSMPSFFRFLAKAKRTEAYMNLGTLYLAEKAYWAENGKYTTQLIGKEGAGWQPEGYSGGGANERFYYTYGFNGQEGHCCFTGKLGANGSSLGDTKADATTFLAAAIGDIDGDGIDDRLTVDHRNEIKITHDDLA
ncbi:MAG TPA: prepilin-type N-terminal cleavage/methylation domain-containing protein [Candidatus Babeliales bacterium]|nr:prepilin-type N-terminal cleavage/methylation domain-containing protein [Candidatus Babeliales bacterium]